MMRARLEEIFRTVLGDESIALEDNTRAADLPGWDSLTYVNAMFGVEQECVQFIGDEFARVQTVGELEDLLAARGAS